MKQYYLTYRGIICRTDSAEVSRLVNRMGWQKISRREYYKMKKAIRVASSGEA